MASRVLTSLRASFWHLRQGGLVQLKEHRRRAAGSRLGMRGAQREFALALENTKLRVGRNRDLRVPEWDLRHALAQPPRHSLTVGAILDPFSELCFRFEWNQVPLSPSGWRTSLEETPIDLLFVESAWNGNDGAWQYQLTGSKAPSQALKALVDHCRDKGVPTVFWNKEDPAHFSDFLGTARLFDWVYTTDSNKVAEYKKALGHRQVGVLPFAAQPSIQNPTRPEGWDAGVLRGTAFAGTYFRHKYAERAEQMRYLLGGAAEAAERAGETFDIFARFQGLDPNYQYPEEWQRFVRGQLNYRQMLTAYRTYRTFLNVNSVVDSPSMCARRIFEITACGTPVLSAPSEAIPSFFPEGGVFIAEDRRSAYDWVRALGRSPELRDRNAKLGQRQIWKANTYAHRVNKVLDDVGMGGLRWAPPTVSAMVSTNRPHQLRHVAAQMARQQDVDLEVLILTHGFQPDREQKAVVESLLPEVQWVTADETAQLGQCYNILSQNAQGQVVAKIDDDDLYGPFYLFDQLAAMDYAGADVVGKGAHYLYLAGLDATVLRFPEAEHRYRDFVSGPTIVARRDLVLQQPFPNLRRGEDTGFLRGARDAGATIYSADRFGFIQMRAGHSDHTWQISQEDVLATANVHGYGLDAGTALF